MPATQAKLPTLADETNFAWFGEPEFKHWGIAASVHRDSDILDRSNWRVIVAGVQQQASTDNADGWADWQIERCSHWAVGWVEYLLVRPDSPAYHRAIEWADKLADYPIANEDDYSQLELDEHNEYHTDYKDSNCPFCQES